MNKLRFFLVLGFLASLQWGCSNSATNFALPSTQETFGQVITYNNKVDILFVIDNSSSMSQHQQRLAAKVPDMINTLNSLKMDYHVAVTTTTMTTNLTSYPMSRQILGTPKYLTSTNISLLSNRLLAGEAGSDLERGLDAMVFATGSYAVANAPGYLRSDALFVIIFMGDEDDQSSEFGSGNSNDFVNYLNKLKPPFAQGGRAWIANFIGSLQNQNCDNLGGQVSIGFNYLRLAEASSGIKESICSGDLSVAVANIKARIVDQLTQFRLKSEPRKSTIRIAVGGHAVVESAIDGWTLETEGIGSQMNYFIRFHGSAIPAADQGVQIDFTPMSAT